MRSLTHPPEAEKDKDSLEMLRAWVVNQQLQIVLAAWVWQDDLDQWGCLLAEAAGHLADAIADETGKSREEVSAIISASIIRNLEDPADDLIGEFVDPVQQ
jgi:hypothetical protein